MSRDRLAALRAQQAAQRTNGPSQQQPADGYGAEDGYAGSGGRYAASNGGYGYETNTYNEPTGPPSYRSYTPTNDTRAGGGYYSNARPSQDEGMDEDARGQRAKDSRRRRPSTSADSDPRNGYGNGPGYGQGDIPPVPAMPVPAQYSYPQNTYGDRQDESAYLDMNKNASHVALSYDYEDNDREKYKGYPPQASRKGSRDPPDTYTIPILPRNDGRPSSRSQQQPTSPAVALSPAPGAQTDAPHVDMAEFFSEIGSIRNAFKDLENMILYLDQLHSRSLQGTASEEIEHEFDKASDKTRKLTNQLRAQIKALQETTRIRTHGQAEHDRQTRKIQVGAVREKFLEILQSYQNMEMRNRDKAKQRIERQYQIVKPEASPDEIRQAVNSGQEVQVFAQALRQTNRVRDARGVLDEVQSRHEDIKKIEKTLVELFQLFQDMAIMVEEQDEQIIHIETKATADHRVCSASADRIMQAEAVAKDMEIGHQEIQKGMVSAKKARKKRKICCIILIILLLVLGGVIAYVVVKVIIPKVNESKNNDAGTTTTINHNSGTTTVKVTARTAMPVIPVTLAPASWPTPI